MKLTKEQAQLVQWLCAEKIAQLERDYPPLNKLPLPVAYDMYGLKYNLTLLDVSCNDFIKQHELLLKQFAKRKMRNIRT